MIRRHELTDDQWAVLAPRLPPQRAATGRPAKNHRTVLNGILWRLKPGVPWRDLPERYGPWQTVSTRFRRWQQAGVWARILANLQADAAARGNRDWDLPFLDGTTIRAHPQAAGATKGAATKPSGTAAAASAPSSTCAPSGAADRSPGR